MYSTRSGLILGFHGCDNSVAEEVVWRNGSFQYKENPWDWLGHGVYFWENNPKRALDYANELMSTNRADIKIPTVVGAVINLGHCLDLLNHQNLQHVKTAYEILADSFKKSRISLPQNKNTPGTSDFLLRYLDCAVIETLHKVRREENGAQSFDSVRGVFWEGKELYPNSGFREKDHIQICVINPNCIKGVFLEKKLDDKYSKV